MTRTDTERLDWLQRALAGPWRLRIMKRLWSLHHHDRGWHTDTLPPRKAIDDAMDAEEPTDG